MRGRVSAIGGLAFASTLGLGFVLDFGIFATTGGPPQLFAASLRQDLARAGTSTVWPVELWTYILAIIPFAFYLPGLRVALGDRDELLDVGALMAVIFILLHTVHNIAYAAIVSGLAPAYVSGTAAGVATEQVARGLIALAETAFLPGGGIGALPLVIALVIFGLAQRRGGARKTGGLALAAAGLTALGYLRLIIPDMVALGFGLAGWVAFIAWVATTSLAMRGFSASASESASPSGSRWATPGG